MRYQDGEAFTPFGDTYFSSNTQTFEFEGEGEGEFEGEGEYGGEYAVEYDGEY